MSSHRYKFNLCCLAIFPTQNDSQMIFNLRRIIQDKRWDRRLLKRFWQHWGESKKKATIKAIKALLQRSPIKTLSSRCLFIVT